MIKELEIAHFKSIKTLKLDCKRINIFLGEPNTGKSNLLEALGFLSYARFPSNTTLRDFVRYQRTTNLFYDEAIENQVVIRSDNCTLKLEYAKGSFPGVIRYAEAVEAVAATLGGDYNNLRLASYSDTYAEKLPAIKFYKFRVLDKFDRPESEFLLPPDGRNLLTLLLANKELRSTVSQILSRSGLKLGLKPQDSVIEIIKQVEDVIISYPYALLSDTLQRLIFLLSAVLTNKSSTLVLDHPESHSFPYYTKYLAEIMALDQANNQYFIATHNPYFLLPIVEKTAKEDIAIFITYFKDYETRVKPLSQKDVEEIMQIDVFSNLDRYLKL